MNGMWSESRYKVILLAVAMLSLAIIIGGYLLGDGLLRARQADRSVTVKGLAEKNVTADLATWNLSFSKQGFDINDVQSAIDHDANEILAFFKTMDIPDNALDRKSVVKGRSVSVRLDLGGGRTIKKKKKHIQVKV